MNATDTAIVLEKDLIEKFPETPIAVQAEFEKLKVYHCDLPKELIDSFGSKYKGFDLTFIQALSLHEDLL